jgi:RNA ligase
MYTFPVIESLDQVRDAIKNREEFFIAERDFGYVVNYTHVGADTFPDLAGPFDKNILLRECRGLIFDKDGRVLSRPYHKFFNQGEREETSMENILHELSIPHIFLEKLDGSMIRPIWYPDGSMRFGTKMGVTETAIQAEMCLANFPNHQKYITFMRECRTNGCTPIFEFCSRQNKIVIDYPKPRLVLTAVRSDITGSYWPYEYMVEQAELYGLDYVKAWDGVNQSIQGIINHIRNQDKIEGYVIRFNNGHMIKVKADWYVSLHRTKDAVRFEKNVLNIIAENKLDDLLPLLDQVDRDRVVQYQAQVNARVVTVCKAYDVILDSARFSGASRKEFALDYAVKLPIQSIAFDLYGKKKDNTREAIMDYVARNCSTPRNLKKVKDFLGGLTYDEGPDE